MFEDLDDNSGFNPQSPNQQYQKPPAPPPPQNNNQGYQSNPSSEQRPQQQGGYQNNQGGGYQQKSYQNKPQGGYGGGGGGGFARKEEVVEDAYFPVAFYVEKDFPEEVKDQLFALANKMIAKKMTVRINADDKVFIDRLKVLTDKNLEVYMPWRDFNQIDSKRTWNTLTSKDVASKHFLGWEKIPDSVKAMLAAQVRMVFGDKNNSIMLCLVTWTRDGASKASEVTKDTGRSSFVIKMASSYGFPILNMMKPQTQLIVEKTFSL